MIERFYELGLTDLMPVIPPDATIAPYSRVSPGQAGKIPGRITKEGWVGYDLTQQIYLSPEQASKYERIGSNFGLASDRFPGLDIDVDDPVLTSRLLPTFFKLLGPGPVRTSRPGRALIMYRSAEPLPRVVMKMTRTDPDEEHIVELLGKGRQYVVQGQHPDGHQYGFLDAHPPVPAAELEFVTLDEVLDVFGQVKEALEAGPEGWTVEIHQEGDRVEREMIDQADLKAPSAKELALKVKEIPNTYDDRRDWIRVGHAIKAAAQDFPSAGYAIWEWWSNQWEGGNEPEEIERNWDRMRSPYEVGWPYLVSLAGGAEALAQEMFTSDPDAAPEPAAREIVPSDAPAFTDRWALDQIQGELADQLIYNPHRGTWMIWNGHLWEADDDGKALDRFGALLQEVAWELIRRGNAAGGNEGKPMITAAKKYQNYPALKAVLALAESRLGVSNDAFDADTMKLNTPAGVVDLRSGEVSPPSPEVLVSRSTAVAPADSYSKGDAPMWEAFLRDLTDNDPEMVAYIRRLCGYCLTGDVSEKSLFYIWGSRSDTGKSTFIRTVQEVMGGYSDTVPVDTVIGGQSGAIPADLAKIAGARLVTATEPKANQSWNEDKVKAMTGGDLISARFMRQNFFDYYPTYKILIVGNHEPDMENVDDAMLRRVKILPANHKVPRDRQVPELDKIMVEREGPAILRWMIDGCLEWQEHGLGTCKAVEAATAAYVEEEAILDQFVEERCRVAGDVFISRARLYREWRNFCHTRGEDPGSEKGFKRLFAPKAAELDLSSNKRGQDPGDDKYRRGYEGITIDETHDITFTVPGE